MISMSQVVLFLAITLLLAPLGKRVGMPVELSYLAIGVLFGPFVLNMAGDAESLSSIAEFGVVLFLFLIGLELQPTRLAALKKPILLLGGAQVIVTGVVLTFVVYAVGLMLGKQLYWATAGIIGFSLSMSSTAFALQLLTNKKQLNSQHGRKAFAILLFQDIAVIPLLAILPLLAGKQIDSINPILLLKVVAVFAAMFLATRHLLKPLFDYVAESKVAELFTVAALFVVLGASWLMHSIGVSMAMGTFLAGVLLANSVYRHQLVASIEPFKGLLLGLFFVTIGLNTPVNLFLQHPHWFVLAAIALMFVKALVIMAIAKAYGSNWLVSLRMGVILSQGGEFAFVLFNAALHEKVLKASVVDPLIMVVILSILFTPMLLWAIDRWVVPKLKALEQSGSSAKGYDDLSELSHHQPEVIIAGFGRIGQIIARILRMRGIAFTAIDHNIKQVEFVRRHGNRVYYGHASSLNVLRAAGIEKAKVIIITISDQQEAIKTVERIRQSFNHVKIFARARDRFNYYRMVDVGADKVWRETFATSLDVASQTLTELGLPADDVQDSIRLFQEYDEHLLAKQQAIFTDEESLRQSAIASHDELELLFESDHKKFNDKLSP